MLTGGTGELPIRDVVLFEGSGEPFDPRRNTSPPIKDRLALGGGVHVERLPAELNRKIKSACAFRGHNWEIHMDTLPTLYTFVREAHDSAPWDEDERLGIAIALSRLCNPTSVAMEFAARVYAPGVRHQTDYVIEPALIAGHGNQAFIPDPDGRNWLTVDDVADLPAMTEAFASAPERVRRAAWFHEYAARTEHVPVRLTLVAAGIEALVHIEKRFSTKQFVVGAVGLATDCGLTFTTAQASDAYDQRSRYAHGVTVRSAPPQVLIELETVLRAAIRKTLRDSSYADIFAADASIRARFPL
jgi:hypothetical protein